MAGVVNDFPPIWEGSIPPPAPVLKIKFSDQKKSEVPSGFLGGLILPKFSVGAHTRTRFYLSVSPVRGRQWPQNAPIFVLLSNFRTYFLRQFFALLRKIFDYGISETLQVLIICMESLSASWGHGCQRFGCLARAAAKVICPRKCATKLEA